MPQTLGKTTIYSVAFLACFLRAGVRSRCSFRHLGSEPPCGDAAQNPFSLPSECQLPLKQLGRIKVAEKVRTPPPFADAAGKKRLTAVLTIHRLAMRGLMVGGGKAGLRANTHEKGAILSGGRL